ncbi:CPBP family intramembrane glutamic endopeptidase [Streptomyces scopuliridis]|uniref:CPBP family intramembrane glutamic endopeptidase n=1 Tax=Streptomyces scopuliridis TaxID=452529 RepID=UPI0036824337
MPFVALVLGISPLLSAEDSAAGGGAWVGWHTLLPVLPMLVLLVPLQAAAEEYVARGWLPQVAGGFLRSPWAAALPQAPLFAAAHGWGTPWGFVDLAFFGLVAGLLAVRTGGIEASIALHVTNNLLGYVLFAATGGLETDATAADAPWLPAVTNMAMTAAYAAVVLRLANRQRLDRHASVEAGSPPAVHTSAPYPPKSYTDA